MKILITGGAGYIGSVLTKQLASSHVVTVLDNGTYGFDSLKNMPVTIWRKDVRNLKTEDVKSFDVVVHLASIVGKVACDLDPRRTTEINYDATKQIAKICAVQNTKLVFSSTCSVYGSSEKVLSEQGPTNPLSLYAKTKLEAENKIKESACDYLILRFGTVFGYSYRMRFDLVVNLFTAKSLKKEKLQVFNENMNRPFIHVKDAASVIQTAIEKDWNGIYNVAWKNYTILEAAKTIADYFHNKIEITKGVMGEARDYRINLSKLSAKFKPKHNLQTGIIEIETAYNHGLWFDYTNPLYSNHKVFYQTNF